MKCQNCYSSMVEDEEGWHCPNCGWILGEVPDTEDLHEDQIGDADV